jgi:predicted transposase/invertase (TIGR01784 family)
MGILELIAAKPETALEKAQAMVPRLKSSDRSQEFQRIAIQFLETVMVHQFPKMTREEIEKMLQVSDFRETRVFQEALEEGMEKGREEGREEMLEKVVFSMLDAKLPTVEIAKFTGLSAAQIRAIKKRGHQ